MRRCLIGLTTFCLAFTLPAQQQAAVTAVVRNEKGDSVPFARVRATMTGTDVTVNANARGIAALSLPFGTARLAVTTLGYEPLSREITIDREVMRAEFILKTTAQQLNNVNVRAKWVGIRGGVGDEITREPIAGAVITMTRSKFRGVTDSAGRFEIPLSEAQGAILQIAKPGYETKPVRVEVLPDQPSDVVFFLKPGKDPLYLKVALGDLGHREGHSPFFNFTADRTQLKKGNSKTVYDALIASGLLTKNKMQLGNHICLFVNGLARPGFMISTVVVDDIEFIEVYGQKTEITGTLMAEWPYGQGCTAHEPFFPTLNKGTGKNIVGIVSVWTAR